MLVDTALQQAEATGGATRAEVETAMADLVRTGAAIKLIDRDGIVISRPPEKSVSSKMDSRPYSIRTWEPLARTSVSPSKGGNGSPRSRPRQHAYSR